jgi:hypothetical protein
VDGAAVVTAADAMAADAVSPAEREAEAEVLEAQNAAEVAWAADAPTAIAWEGEVTSDDVEPVVPVETPAWGASSPEVQAWNAAETLPVAEAFPADPMTNTPSDWSAPNPSPALETAPGTEAARPGAEAVVAAPGQPQAGDDYAQWEADFAAALDGLDSNADEA